MASMAGHTPDPTNDSGSAPRQETEKKSSERVCEKAPERPGSASLKNAGGSSDGVLPMSLIKALQRKSSSRSGSNGSSNGSGNNSDNSGFVSIENGSFGFNFDTDDAIINPSSLDGPGGGPAGPGPSSALSRKFSSDMEKCRMTRSQNQGDASSSNDVAQVSSGGNTTSNASESAGKSAVSSLTSSSHEAAAAAAVANLNSIATLYSSVHEMSSDRVTSSADEVGPRALPERSTAGAKRSAANSSAGENDSGGYNSDDSSNDGETSGSRTSGISRPRKKKRLDENKREERNAREKERSFRISKQISELRNLLSSGGVVVPKGTKSSVLSEAANYIRVLQQHQYRSEIDRHQLVQQMQMIGGGALGTQAASAVRHVAAQNGLWSLGNFGGVPPKSAMSFYEGTSTDGNARPHDDEGTEDMLSPSIAEHEYRFVFNSCSVGMAIASMGGAFIDCNQLFSQLSGFTKQELCSMTVFNLTSQEDLQQAFDLISQMISPPADARLGDQPPKPCVLRGKMKERADLGLSVALIRDEDKIAKCFCVTLIKNPSSPYDPSKPVPATPDMILSSPSSKAKHGGLSSGHAYTTG